jgi:hypothetical protein
MRMPGLLRGAAARAISRSRVQDAGGAGGIQNPLCFWPEVTIPLARQKHPLIHFPLYIFSMEFRVGLHHLGPLASAGRKTRIKHETVWQGCFFRNPS